MTSDTTKLAEGVAGLLPNKMPIAIEKGLKYDGKEYSALAFECHKALLKCYGKCQIGKGITALSSKHPWYIYGESNQIKGAGTTDEEAIFAAVMDAYDKREGE